MSSLGSSFQVVLDVKWTAIQLEMSETRASEWLQQKIAIGDSLAFFRLANLQLIYCILSPINPHCVGIQYGFALCDSV
jgi:hypothetical protein